MKRIYFIRHAKANEGTDDFNRDLSERGKKDLAFMCERLKEHRINVDAIFSSSAKRSEKTALKMANSVKFDKKIKLKDELYTVTLDSLLKFIKGLNNELNDIFIISHNNAITEVCEFLSDSAIGNIPTCGIFCIKFECDFANITEHCGKALFFEHPKSTRNRV